MQKNIIITGTPRIGKSTELYNLITSLKNKKGFLTKEIREHNERVGFQIELSTGEIIPFAHIHYTEEQRVSKYGIKPENLRKALQMMAESIDEDIIIYVDEIGQMQLLSSLFEKSMRDMLNSKNTVIATMSTVFQNEFIEEIKKRDDVILVTITEDNKSKIPEYLSGLVQKIGKAKKYVIDKSRFKVTPGQISVKSDHSTRTIIHTNGSWVCCCEFYKKWKICSHTIAARALKYI